MLGSVLGYYFLDPIINTSVFSEFSSKKLFVIQFFISTMHSISFSIWCFTGPRRSSSIPYMLTAAFLYNIINQILVVKMINVSQHNLLS